jgi:hypothetical protein
VAARIRGPYPNSHFFAKAVAEKLILQRFDLNFAAVIVEFF